MIRDHSHKRRTNGAQTARERELYTLLGPIIPMKPY
jgi:hypothetical protein